MAERHRPPDIALPFYVAWLGGQPPDAVAGRQQSATQNPLAIWVKAQGYGNPVVIRRIPHISEEEIRTRHLRIAPYRLYWDPRLILDPATKHLRVGPAHESSMDLDPAWCALLTICDAHPSGLVRPSHPPLDLRADTMLMLARRILADPPMYYTIP